MNTFQTLVVAAMIETYMPVYGLVPHGTPEPVPASPLEIEQILTRWNPMPQQPDELRKQLEIESTGNITSTTSGNGFTAV